MGADVYFWLAKLTHLAMTPSVVFLLALVLAFVLAFTPKRGFGRVLLGFSLLAYGLFAVLPGGMWVLRPLEDRFPAINRHLSPVTGIIVLGGPLDTQMTRERGQVSLGGGAERLTEFLRLARLYPEARLVFSGGSGRMFDRKPTEAEVAARFFAEQGLDLTRVWFEDRSRNTSESARYTYETLHPQAGERWVLITSARHMPRAMGLFRNAGWAPTAYPVDYQTRPGDVGPQILWPPSTGYVDMAAYEWGGLLVAWLRGRIDEPFPGPRSVAQEKP